MWPSHVAVWRPSVAFKRSVGQILNQGEAKSARRGQSRSCMSRFIVWGNLGGKKMSGNQEHERVKRMCLKLKCLDRKNSVA